MRVLDHPLGFKVILGAVRERNPHSPRLHLRDYRVGGALPTAPRSYDYLAKALPVVTNSEMNNSLGCCVVSEDAHWIGVATGNAGTLFQYSDAQVVADYSKIAGYVPGNASTDQGTDPVADLDYRVKVGYADGSKDLGYLMVDGTNPEEILFAGWAFGNLKLWGNIPESWVSPFPTRHGTIWDAADPNPANGHCIGAYGGNQSGGPVDLPELQVVGVTAQGVWVVTWGIVVLVTNAALARVFTPAAGGGIATRVNIDWLNRASNAAPNQLAWNDVLSDFDTMGGSIPVPAPGPAPVPPPAPAPTSPPSLSAAQAAIASAMGGDFPLVVRATAISQAQAALAPLWPAA